MKLTNIKVSLKSHARSLNTVLANSSKQACSVKTYNNFIVIRFSTNKLVFTIFKNTTDDKHHINVTNLKKFQDLSLVLSCLRQLELRIIPGSIKIDNITGLIFTNIELNLSSFLTVISSLKGEFDHLSLNTSYNNERFPGMFIKFKNSSSGERIGTAIIFHSGKIVLVGCRKISHLECLSKTMNALIRMR